MKTSHKILVLGLLAIVTSQVNAAGYKMEFQSASVLADAGEAAVVEDAGTNWYNSAGLVYLPLQFVGSAIDVYAPTKFHGSVFAPSTLNQFGPPFSLFASNFRAHGNANSHPNALIPATHLSVPIKRDCIALGFSMVPAWGFAEYYGGSSILRYNLVRVYTKTLDLTSSVAFKINSQWSVGIGPDLHYFSAQSKARVRTQSFLTTTGDSRTRFSADDWAWGGHAGILFRYNDCTRIGLNYRSKLMMHLKGNSSFGLSGVGFFKTDKFRLAIPLPPTVSLSIYHDINPCWAIMGTIAYDHWHTIQNYVAKNFLLPPTPLNASPSLVTVVQPQHMHDTVDFGIGTHYRINEKLMMRANFKYEPTPVVNSFRYVSFPDAPKYGFQIGGRYQATPCLALDVIYGHVFTPRVRVHDVNPVTLAVARGHNHTTIDLLGGQVVWNI